jgi:copper transport protein
MAAVLALPGVAAAHATLTSATPATQSRVQAPPTEVRLTFDEPVSIFASAVLVLAPNGAVLSGKATSLDGGKTVVTPVKGLRRGVAYTVRWRVTSSDGHSPAGVFTFGVGVPAPPPTEAVGASGATWRDDLARWGLFAALALLIGPLVVRLLVLRGAVPPALELRVHALTTVAAFLVIDVGIAAFVIRASNALQLPGIDVLYGDLQPFAQKTRFGIAFLAMTFGFGVVALFLVLCWVSDRLWLRWPALVLSLLLASGLSLSGHQATEPNGYPFTRLADWLHLVAASVWVGGLATLALCVWPAAPELRRRAFLGFSRLAVVLVGVMVLAGAYLALVRLPELSDLWSTHYGHVLLVKVWIVAFALAWGGLHHFVVRPRLEAGGDPRVRPSLLGELSLAFVLLLVAAALTNSAPPPAPEPATTTARSTR